VKVVIQCAASKDPNGGYLRTPNGTPVMFVANPKEACRRNVFYARPDDLVDPADRRSWREVLVEYNRREADRNHDRLLPAYRLYRNKAYNNLVSALGQDRVYILSAGWGVIRSDFLTPQYDITFSAAAEPYKRRRKRDLYADFRHIGEDVKGPILFFGGQDYIPLFCHLTAKLRAERIIFYNSSERPEATGCRLVKYRTRTRTNWHYECVSEFLDDRLRYEAR
jgi:hypothetical protein